jgi:hypothetical protein
LISLLFFFKKEEEERNRRKNKCVWDFRTRINKGALLGGGGEDAEGKYWIDLIIYSFYL